MSFFSGFTIAIISTCKPIKNISISGATRSVKFYAKIYLPLYFAYILQGPAYLTLGPMISS